MRLFTIIMGILLSSGALSQGYSGTEVSHTQVYHTDYTASITVLRQYKDGFFLDVEIFNTQQEVFTGIGFQHADQTSVVDIRINTQNTKIFLMKRF